MKKIIDFISSILGFASTLASIISFFSESTSLIVSILLLGCSIILLVFIPLIMMKEKLIAFRGQMRAWTELCLCSSIGNHSTVCI